jgi:nucleotide-binding universal stress UspA family protein
MQRKESVSPVTTIVVGYVAKPEGDAALDRAIAEAQLRDASLVIVNSHRGGASFDGDDELSTAEELGSVRERLAASGVPFDVRQMVRGLDPAEDLIGVAEEVNADFIIIGLRRRSAVGKLILGSNAQRILLDASCPVLAVKATS